MSELTYATDDDMKDLSDDELAYAICFFLSGGRTSDWWEDDATIGGLLLNEWRDRHE